MKHPAFLAFAVTCAATCATAQADDSLGLYISGAVGQADLRADRSITSTQSDVSEHHTGWKALVGVRPLSFVGAERINSNNGSPDMLSLGFTWTFLELRNCAVRPYRES